MGNVISLNRVRVEGTTLVWRNLRHRLTARAAFELAEELGWLLSVPGQSALHGWLVTATRDRVTLAGWDMGPIVLTRDEAINISLDLARAVAPIARTIDPAS